MTYKKKLIEVALPLAVINQEAAREKSIRHGHPSTLHLWWARRPLAAARAVLWASLVDDPSAHPERFPTEEDQLVERKRLFDILERLVPWEASNDPDALAEARAEIVNSCDGDLPKILDPFAGGGAIPLEALRLGLPTYTGDLNPVAVLIQRAMLEIPQRFAGQAPVHSDAQNELSSWTSAYGLAADVRAYGEWMREEAHRRIGRYYPDAVLADGTSAKPIAWIWARTVRSPDPSWPGRVPLVRSWILAKKPGKPLIWVEPVIDEQAREIRYEIREGGSPPEGSVSGGNGVCVATGAPIPASYIKAEGMAGRIGADLLAVVVDTAKGRAYLAPDDESRLAATSTPEATWRPSGAMGDHPQYMGTPRYGLDEWWKLFTRRQLLALTTFSDLLPEVRTRVERDCATAGLAADGVRFRDAGGGATAYADAILTFLALGLSRMSDMCNALCRWESSRTQVRNLFGRQAIPMVWDFAENNVFNDAGGDFRTSLGSVLNALERLPAGAEASVAQRDARARIAEVGTCVVCTDPPYYDNVPYSDLSDFFFVWLRRNLADVWPDECATLLAPKAEELVANQYRAGSKEAAHQQFEVGMRSVFEEVATHTDARFPATVFYAFKASETHAGEIISTGWETFLTGLIDAGFTITSTWPMRTELGNRMRATGSNALASSVVLACRPREVGAPMATRGEFIHALRTEMEPAIRLMQAENIAPVDLAQSAIGPGMGIFSRSGRVVEADGSSMTVRAALVLINEVLAEVLSGEESELEPDSRFALTWFDQYGHNPGPFGDAETLAKAKNTTVAGVVEAGVAASRAGKVRLLERSELPHGWDPSSDRRLTVWETTQYLIRALESSETDAAELLVRLGSGIGDRARQLAYLLYGICDRKNWADEAGAYNMLVTAWPEIVRLASISGAGDGGQLSMG